MTVGLEGRKDQFRRWFRENFGAWFRASLFSLSAGVQRGSVAVLRPGERLEVAQLSATVPIASQDRSAVLGVKSDGRSSRSDAAALLMPGGVVQTLGIGRGPEVNRFWVRAPRILLAPLVEWARFSG